MLFTFYSLMFFLSFSGMYESRSQIMVGEDEGKCQSVHFFMRSSGCNSLTIQGGFGTQGRANVY